MRESLKDVLKFAAESGDVETVVALLGELRELEARLFYLLTRRPEPKPEEKLLSVSEVAARLRVSREWVYRNSARLPSRRLGRRFYSPQVSSTNFCGERARCPKEEKSARETTSAENDWPRSKVFCVQTAS